MRIDDDARFYLKITLTLDRDLTGSTVALEVDNGTKYACTWQGAATQVGANWVRVALTNAMFCGSAVTPGGSDVQLTAGSHSGQPIVTLSDGQIVPGPSRTIQVT